MREMDKKQSKKQKIEELKPKIIVEAIDVAWKDAEHLLDIKFKEETKEEREFTISVFDSVIETWKREIYTDWIPCVKDEHFCVVRTYNRKQKTDVHNIQDNCDIVNIPFTLFKSKDGDYHPCIQGHCKYSKDHEFYQFLHFDRLKYHDEIYVCSYSAKPHYCGSFCSICNRGDNREFSEDYKRYEKDIYNDDGTLSCPLTGTCFNKQKNVGTFDTERDNGFESEQFKREYRDFMDNCVDDNRKLTNVSVKAVVSGKSMNSGGFSDELGIKMGASDFTKKNKMKIANGVRRSGNGNYYNFKRKEVFNVIDNNMDGVIKSILQSETASVEDILRQLKRGKYQSYKEYYTVIASLKLADIMRPSKIVEHRTDNERKIQKIIKPFSSYFNGCIAKGDTPNVCELSAIMKSEERTLYNPPNINLPLGFLMSFVMDYSRLCVNAWYAIITQTRLGKENPTLFKFTDFVDAFVSFMKSGYSMEISPGRIVDIYEKSKFFNIIPNVDDDERKKGDYVSKHKRKHVAQMKKNIQSAMMETILNDNIHYKLLSPYDYDYEVLEEKYFSDIKGCPKTAPVEKNLLIIDSLKTMETETTQTEESSIQRMRTITDGRVVQNMNKNTKVKTNVKSQVDIEEEEFLKELRGRGITKFH